MARKFVLSREISLRREVAELEALYEIARTLSQSLSIKESLTEVFHYLARNMGLARIVLVLYDDAKEKLLHYHSLGLTVEEQRRAVYKLGEGITGRVFQSGKPEAIPDIQRDPHFLNRTRARSMDGNSISFICVPVTVKNVPIGTLSVDRVKGLNPELQEDVRLLTIVASLVGQALSLFRKMEKTISELEAEKESLRAELKQKYNFPSVIGETPVMQELLALARKVATSEATVLLLGESGTGKERLSRIIHFQSKRKEKPLIKVDCGCIPEHLIESELYGFVKGAFTGATFSKKGKIEEADNGTLFLDEISNLSLPSQTKLLRFLEERVIYRLGSNEPIHLDVRVIAATNEDLYQKVAEKTFRQDLFHRLNVFPIQLPPLSQRREDIPLLVRFFLEQSCAALKKKVSVTEEALFSLTRYDYPGNVRELQNLILRLCILKEEGGSIESSDVLRALPDREQGALEDGLKGKGLRQAALAAEREAILNALKEANGVKAKAARLLGISDRALRYKMKNLLKEP